MSTWNSAQGRFDYNPCGLKGISLALRMCSKRNILSDARLIHKCSFHSLVLISSGLPQWRLNIFLCVSEQLQDALAARVIYQSHIEGTDIKS